MRITALKGRIGPWGDNRDDEPLELHGTTAVEGSGDRAYRVMRDLREAVHRDHSCDDRGCDIREAAEAGFDQVAAAMLVGSVETDYTARVMRIYGLRPDPTAAPEWDAWRDHHAEWGRECNACGGVTYAHELWEPTECADCGALLEARCDVCHRAECDCWD